MEESSRNWTVSLTRSGLIGFEPRTRPERFPGIKRRGSPLQKGLQVKANPVKEKLRNGEATVGTWLSLGDLSATRTLARAGFDWLTVDMEHWPIDWAKAASLFGAISDAGCVPLARVPSGSHDNIKRALDSGAWGVVVPMVDTVEEADDALEAGADRLLVDNMTDADVREVVLRSRGRAEIEISGGVTLKRMPGLVATGADYVSVGALTHSAPSVDFSLELERSDH